MTDNKLTDEQIIQAWECCASVKVNSCGNCPFKELCFTDGNLHRYTLDIFNRQKAEIERLQKENKTIRYCYQQAKSYNNSLAESCEKNCKKFNMITRAEARKEFAEKFKKKYDKPLFYLGSYEQFAREVDNLLKEMDGDTE